MQLCKDLVMQFQRMHAEEFGEVISLEAAERDLLDLIEIVRIIHEAAGEYANER